MDIATLGIKVESSQVRSAAADFDRFTQAGRRAEIGAKSVERSFATVSRAASLLKGALAGISVGLVVREYIRLSDQFSTLNARLKLVTSSAQEYNKAQSAIFDIAARTRTDVQATADLYVRLSNATQDLGASQEEVLGVTETINQALQVSGANAQSAAAALVQLGQGFASGVLRGEELNSVLEQAPRLAQAIADGLGVPLGKLRELGQQGKLTAAEVFQALQKSATRISQEFARLPLTVGGATTQVRNAVLELIGAFDQASGASGGLASLISDVSTSIRGLAADVRRLQADGSIARWADDVRFAIEDVVDGAAVLGASLQLLDRFAVAAGTVQRNSVLWLFSDDARREIEQSKADFQRALAEMQSAYQKFTTRETQPRAGTQTEDFLPQPKRPKATGGGGTGRAKVSETERYLEQLRRQIGNVYELTAAEQLEYDIREGLLKLDGKISKERLMAVAQELDAIKQRRDEEKSASRDVIEAMNEERRVREQLVRDAIRETADIRKGNDELRDEIQLIGANAQAKKVIEQARVSSAIAIKTEALASADLNALSEDERRALREQITLLRERLVLLDQKGLAEALKEDFEAQQEFVKNAAENIQRYLGDSLYDVLSGDFKSIADSFTQMVNRMVAEAIAADLAKYLLGDLIKGGTGKGVVGSLFEKFAGSLFGASSGTSAQLNMMTYMAKGGVVGGPTLFQYNGGRTGMMGEDGPEGVMPLMRDSKGRLGVIAAGGSQSTQVSMTVVTQDAESFRRSEGQITSRLAGALSRSRRYA